MLVLPVQPGCSGFDSWFVCCFLFLTGTFALETDKVVYGLVFPIRKSDILYVQVSRDKLSEETGKGITIYSNPEIERFPRVWHVFLFQFHYYLGLWTKSKKYTSIRNKLLTFVNGPSWRPGKSRLGDHANNPPVSVFEQWKAFSIVCVCVFRHVGVWTANFSLDFRSLERKCLAIPG